MTEIKYGLIGQDVIDRTVQTAFQKKFARCEHTKVVVNGIEFKMIDLHV